MAALGAWTNSPTEQTQGHDAGVVCFAALFTSDAGGSDAVTSDVFRINTSEYDKIWGFAISSDKAEDVQITLELLSGYYDESGAVVFQAVKTLISDMAYVEKAFEAFDTTDHGGVGYKLKISASGAMANSNKVTVHINAKKR